MILTANPAVMDSKCVKELVKTCFETFQGLVIVIIWVSGRNSKIFNFTLRLTFPWNAVLVFFKKLSSEKYLQSILEIFYEVFTSIGRY